MPARRGKSILAATYFQSAAARISLDAVAAVAGPEPERVISYHASARRSVTKDSPNDGHPNPVTPAAAAGADVIVNIGCEPSVLPTDKPMIEWDVPLLADDFQGSTAAIHDLAKSLARSLSLQHLCGSGGMTALTTPDLRSPPDRDSQRAIGNCGHVAWSVARSPQVSRCASTTRLRRRPDTADAL